MDPGAERRSGPVAPEPQDMADGGRIVVDRTTHCTTVVLFGEIDAHLTNHLDQLRVELADLGENHEVRVDVRDVTFMDSTGIAFLVRVAKTMTPDRLVLVRPSKQVLFVLDVTQVSEILDVRQ